LFRKTHLMTKVAQKTIIAIIIFVFYSKIRIFAEIFNKTTHNTQENG